MNDWNIQARARSCQGCGRTFGDREAYHTLLFEQRTGLERVDVCGACWDGQHRHGATDRKGFVSHWQGVFSVPPPAPPEPIQRDSAESLLRQLMERDDPALRPAAFILAVMLERKRILRIREQLKREGRRTFVYEMPRTGELFTVDDPALQLDQLEAVQHDVARLLEHGLPTSGTPAAADAAGAAGALDGQPAEEPFVPVAMPSAPGEVGGGGEGGRTAAASVGAADTTTTGGDSVVV